MCRKLFLLTCFILVMSLAGNAPAVDIHWDGGAGSGNPYWNVATNWSTDTVPTSADLVRALVVPGYGPTIIAPGAQAGSVYVSEWEWDGELTLTPSANLSTDLVVVGNNAGETGVLVNGGTINTFNMQVGNDGNGSITNSGTVNATRDPLHPLVPGNLVIAVDANSVGLMNNYGDVNVVDWFYVANHGDGLLNMNAGTIVAYKLDLATQPGTGHVNFHGGTVTLEDIGLCGDGSGTADFTNGTLIVSGNHTVGINFLASVDWWTAYGGWDVLQCDYDGTNTTVCATDVNYSSLDGAIILWQGSAISNRWNFVPNWYVDDYVINALPRPVDTVQLPDTDGNGNPIAEPNRPVICRGITTDANQLFVGGAGLGWVTSYLTMTGGTLNVTNELHIGASPTDGQIDISGGIINAGHMVVGASPQNGTLNMTGGSINVTGPLMYVGGGADANGVFNISGGTVSVDDALNIGAYGGDGTLNMTGGAIDCNVMRIDVAGIAGHVQLDGGSITANYFIIDPNGTMDITAGGMLTLTGDQRWVARTYDASGQLTAYSGSGSLVVRYDPTAGNTSVAATPCPQGDMNWDCIVDFVDFAKMADNWLVDNNP